MPAARTPATACAAAARGPLRLSYLFGGVVTYRPGEVLNLRTLPDFELVRILEGQVIYTRQGIAHAIPPGGVILARPGSVESYAWDRERETRHAYFHFDLERFPADWPPPARWPLFRTRPDPVIGALFDHVIGQIARHPSWPVRSPGPRIGRMVEALIAAFLFAPSGAEPLPGAAGRPGAVQRALQWMRQVLDEDPGRSVTLGDVARHASVSPPHLCRLFASTIGCSPMEALRRLRLQMSLALLGRSELNVKQIARRCGFASPYHFSRRFSGLYGFAPTEVRRSLRRGRPPPDAGLPPDVAPRVHW